MTFDRLVLYNRIKGYGLVERCKEKYGKNFTLCKSADLEQLIVERKKELSILFQEPDKK